METFRKDLYDSLTDKELVATYVDFQKACARNPICYTTLDSRMEYIREIMQKRGIEPPIHRVDYVR